MPSAPTPSTPTPVPVPLHPGSSLSYSGSTTVSDTYTYPTPSPFPSTSVTSSETQAVTVGTSPFPGSPIGPLSDVHSIATVTAPLASSTTTTDAWLGWGAAQSAGLVALLQYGSVVRDATGNTFQTLYGVPQQTDLVPEAAASWSNSPSVLVNETYKDGTNIVRSAVANGTYSETQTTQFGYTLVALTNADGSASYGGTLFTQGYSLQGIFMSAPASGSISVSIAFPTPSPTPSPNPSATPGVTPTPSPQPVRTPLVIAQPAVWYPMPFKPYNETDTLTTGVAYPQSCGVPASYGTAGGHVAQAIDIVDPVLGYTEHKTVDTYTSQAVGAVCVQFADTQKYYYDYADDTQYAYSYFGDFTGNAVHTHAMTSMLTLQAGAVVQSSARRTTQSGRGIDPIAIAAAAARFNARIAVQRERRFAALRSALKHYAARLGGNIK